MVGEIGFEPTTHWSQTSCATKLRYSPTNVSIIVCCYEQSTTFLIFPFNRLNLSQLILYLFAFDFIF